MLLLSFSAPPLRAKNLQEINAHVSQANIALPEILLLSFNAPPIQTKNKQSEVRVPPMTHAVLFPVKTLTISPKKKSKRKETCFGMPRHTPAKAIRLSTQMLILFAYFSERPALAGQD